MGEITSGRTLEAAPICQNAKIPLISPGATAPEFTARGDYIFRVCFIDEFQGTVMAKFARDTLKLNRVAILSSVSSAQSVGLAKYFRERFTASGGMVAIEQKYGEGDKDFRAQLTAIKAADVEGVFVPGYYAEAALIARQARDLGPRGPLHGRRRLGVARARRRRRHGRRGRLPLHPLFAGEQVGEGDVTFNARFRARWGIDTNALSALGYDSALVLIDAIRRAGTTEGPKLRDALAATQGFQRRHRPHHLRRPAQPHQVRRGPDREGRPLCLCAGRESLTLFLL